ncbi:hypothetical protein PG995_015931 [Apiospora arundinis]
MVYVFPIERESQKAIIWCAVVFSILPIVAVVLRMVARSRLTSRTLDLSDWLIVFACSRTRCSRSPAPWSGGMGYHTTEIIAMGGPESITLLMKLVTVVVIFWSLSLGLTKLSKWRNPDW